MAMKSANITEYDSRWQYTKDRSNYHFDPFLPEKDAFRILGRFVGMDWTGELENLIRLSRGGSAYNHYGTGVYLRQLDVNDMKTIGLPEDFYFISKIHRPILSRENAPVIYKIIDWFGLLERSVARIHIQKPGQVFPFHIDNLTYCRGNTEENPEMDMHPENWARFEIQLKDWEWGHVWAIGNNYWKQWRAGDIMYHPWHNIPHGTANCGFAPRVNLQVSGRVSDRTRELMSRDNGLIDLSQIP